MAAEQILRELKEDASDSRNTRNVIYFDGWDGLGASAVLRAVAQRLITTPKGLQPFDQIVHIDCSKWENRRELQRVIAEQLELSAEVMQVFHKQDEEDDYKGVAQGSRLEIPQVQRAIHRRILDLNHNFLVIFHNGASEEVDLSRFGFPLSEYLDNKVLWSFQGRFRLYPKKKVFKALHESIGTKTDVFISASHLEERDPHEFWSVLMHQEAAELAQSKVIMNITEPAQQVAECFFLYMLKLCCMGHNLSVDYDLATHSSNYWICDGLVQQQELGHFVCDDEMWQAVNALKFEIQLDADYHDYNHQYFPLHLVRCGKCMPFRTSPTTGFTQILARAIPNNDIFEDFGKLGWLKLSRRTFSFSSPPFLCCHNLKFLWLDHCQDQDMTSTDSIDYGFPQEEKMMKTSKKGVAGNEEAIFRCFQKMLVLDIRYTCCDRILSAQMVDHMTQLRELIVMGAKDWDMGQLHGRLPNLCKLRVTKSSIICHDCSEIKLFSGINKMELAEFSGNHIISSMTSVLTHEESNNSSSSLETVIIVDGCAGLEKINFKGCTKLQNILLKGLFEDLHTLDLSGTTVKTLDISAMTALKLDELFLLGCGKLCAILWAPEDKRKQRLKKMHIDSTVAASGSAASLSMMHGCRAPLEFDWCISVRDSRLLGSLAPLKICFDEICFYDIIYAQLEISSTTCVASSGSNDGVMSNSCSAKQRVLVNLEQPRENGIYADFSATVKDSEGVPGDATPCPRVHSLDALKCYVGIQDKSATKLDIGSEEAIIVPDFICDSVVILHVHDSLSITSIPGPAVALGSRWTNLDWCRVERCPKLECIFTTPLLSSGEQAESDVLIFHGLRTFWASELPKAHFIWNWSGASSALRFNSRSFQELKLLHLEFCPRLVHVLPLAALVINERSLQNLEAIEIMWCGDLRSVFTSDTNVKEQQHQTITVNFPRLKRIHLYELPMLQGICGLWRLYAPKLEIVRIRGCWNLMRLPAVGNRSSNKKVDCYCEKDWWDRLVWEGLDVQHHHSLYKPIHSWYYKMIMLRRSVLQ